MGFFTGQDKGTKARSGSRDHKVSAKCTRCRRPLTSSDKCPMCSAIVRGHSTGRNAVKVSSHRCTDGKTRVTRNGICGGPC